MNNNSFKITGLLVVTLAIFIGISCQPQKERPKDMESGEDLIPLIYHMSFMQHYTTKLYFSGMEENWGLADIYAHEIEELTEEIIAGNHMDDGIDVSGLLETMLPPQIEQIESAIDARDKAMFERNFGTMIQTCNKCHQSADYGLVKVTVPENNPYAQDFSIQE